MMRMNGNRDLVWEWRNGFRWFKL